MKTLKTRQNIPRSLVTAFLLLAAVPLAAQGDRQIAVNRNKTGAKALPVATVAAPNITPPSGAYRIGAGDVLQVSVWKEPQASVPSVVVRSDGRISLPLVKEIEVLGLTPSEAERLVADRYKQFIEVPEVSMIVKEIRSEKVFVIGGVRKQGSIPLYTPMTVLQVLAEAGGLTEYAKKKGIYVLRTEGQKQVRLAFDYQAQLKGVVTDQALLVRPGDTVVVPQ